MLDTTEGIKYLHNNGILHRDIKQNNLFVISLNNNVNLKLTDFGESVNINLLMTHINFLYNTIVFILNILNIKIKIL